MAVLVACFCAQTYLVYSDEQTDAPLEGPALHGAELWHEQGCQVCHQLYGFGGFLGPDLTNSASELGEGFELRLASVLESGPGQMPRYESSPEEVAALAAFLTAMDRSGVGQVHSRPRAATTGLSPIELAASARFDEHTSALVRRGFEAARVRPCDACHRSFEDVVSGPPDLSQAAAKLSAEQLEQLLRVGRAPAMPPPQPPFSDAEIEAVVAYLQWLASEREALVASTAHTELSLDPSALPWWEYPR